MFQKLYSQILNTRSLESEQSAYILNFKLIFWKYKIKTKNNNATFSLNSLAVVESVILDSRCYLEGGGSAESFLASEDMEIGSIIGKLRINGNPHIEKGDINLSLRERDAPVKIPPGTKNIVLIAPLDKEGIKGSSSIYVDVICDRRHSTDPVSILNNTFFCSGSTILWFFRSLVRYSATILSISMVFFVAFLVMLLGMCVQKHSLLTKFSYGSYFNLS